MFRKTFFCLYREKRQLEYFRVLVELPHVDAMPTTKISSVLTADLNPCQRELQNYVTHFFIIGQKRRSLALLTLDHHARVVLYYYGKTSLGLRCFRQALVIRHKLLQNEKEKVPETKTTYPAGGCDSGTSRTYWSGERYSDLAVAEVGKAAAAITLNNVGVCLASIGETSLATKALVIASSLTM